MKKGLVIICISALITSAFIRHTGSKTAIDAPGYVIDTLATDLTVPWQLVFLPDNTLLFTERPGRVRIYRNSKLVQKPALVVPDIPLRNKSGMLGMVIHPDFANNHFVYVAHDYLQGNLMRLRVTRYEFKNDTLVNPFQIIEGIPANQNHTGCRLVFGPGKKLFITTGDADQPALAQDLKAYNGKILRVNDDGSVPGDNPFFSNDTAHKEIWSYGHRNTQGLAFEPGTGTLFNTEHGPTGGDEINIIRKGQNYGWPVIHHDLTHAAMNSPLIQFTPSIAPGEAMFYTANAFPQLKGYLLVGCLRGEEILKVQLAHDKITGQEVMLKQQYGRIRSIVTGPDGFIYFSTSQLDPVEGTPRPHYDMILRMRPSGTMNTALLAQKLVAGKKASKPAQRETAAIMFRQLCASCHGSRLQGNGQTRDLSAGKFRYGADRASIKKNITNGIIDQGMPSWNGAISKTDINRITEYIYLKTRKRGRN